MHEDAQMLGQLGERVLELRTTVNATHFRDSIGPNPLHEPSCHCLSGHRGSLEIDLLQPRPPTRHVEKPLWLQVVSFHHYAVQANHHIEGIGAAQQGWTSNARWPIGLTNVTPVLELHPLSD
eukprot:6491109-Amphidinium_carterae.1